MGNTVRGVTWARRARVLCAVVSAVLGAAFGCTVEQQLDAVPAYPGSSAGPGSVEDDGTSVALHQVYYSGDGYHEIVAFYEKYVAEQGGEWERRVGGDMAKWKLNMKLGPMMASAAPLDATQPGKLVVVINEGLRTAIRTFSWHPTRP